mgnify:CR=1 FL=1
MVRGLDNDAVYATAVESITTAAVAGAFGVVRIGLDSLTSGAGSSLGRFANAAAVATATTPTTTYSGLPGLGFHFLQAIESGDGTNASLFFIAFLTVLAYY